MKSIKETNSNKTAKHNNEFGFFFTKDFDYYR